jgi:hypothetical protein
VLPDVDDVEGEELGVGASEGDGSGVGASEDIGSGVGASDGEGVSEGDGSVVGESVGVGVEVAVSASATVAPVNDATWNATTRVTSRRSQGGCRRLGEVIFYTPFPTMRSRPAMGERCPTDAVGGPTIPSPPDCLVGG